MRPPILLPIVVGFALLVAVCRKADEVITPDSPLASELKLLERQVNSLKVAIADARRGEMFPPDDLAVSASEEVVQSTLSQALPLEKPLGTEFRARIERATVSFRSMQGSVRLEGRVWALAEPGTYADLVLLGGIHEVKVEKSTGVLTADIVLDGYDVKRAAAIGTESEWIKEVVHLLGDRGLSTLRELVPEVRIPVGIENGIDLPGTSGGALTIPAGHLPFDATVSRVLPLSGRLWAMIHVSTPGWERKAPASRPKTEAAPTRPPLLRPTDPQPVRPPEVVAIPAPAETPVTVTEARRRIQALKTELLKHQEDLRAVLPDDARLMDAPSGDVLIGLPATLVKSIVSEAVTGPLRSVRLTLKDVVKVERSDEIKAKTFLGMMTMGRYSLTLYVREVRAVMKPKMPKLNFGSDRIEIDLPVSVEAGDVKANLVFKWDGQNLAGVVCGDLSSEHDVRAAVPPVLIHLRGRFKVEAKGEHVIVRPAVAPIEMAFDVVPEQRSWDFVDALIKSKNAVCESALRKAAVAEKVRELVARGFKVKVPTNWLHTLTLPASFRDTFDVQGTSAGLIITPTGVSITPTRIWYGANLTVKKHLEPL